MPDVSIITTNWNRKKYLTRVWESIESQTYKNIEWIVCDDGSSDKSVELIENILKKSIVPITFIKSELRVGKSVLDNIAINKSKGSMVLWNDSDDFLLPNAVELAWNAWSKRKADNSYIGVIAFATDGNRIITSSERLDHEIDDTWERVRNIHRVDGDGILMLRRDMLLENPFPEVDFVIPESVVWCKFSTMNVVVMPQVVQIRQYNSTENSISFSGKMQYNRANAYALYTTESELIEKKVESAFINRWRVFVNFIRYSIHGEMSAVEIHRMLHKMKFGVVYFILLPISIILILKDVAQRKVVYTHRGFDISYKNKNISIVYSKN